MLTRHMGFYDCILNFSVASSPENNTDSKNKSWKPQMDALIVTIVAVPAIVIMAAVIPCLIWRLFGVKGNFYF